MTSYITHLSTKTYGLDRIKFSYEREQALLCWLCVYSAVGAAEKTPRSCIITELRNEIYMRVRVRLSAFGFRQRHSLHWWTKATREIRACV